METQHRKNWFQKTFASLWFWKFVALFKTFWNAVAKNMDTKTRTPHTYAHRSNCRHSLQIAHIFDSISTSFICARSWAKIPHALNPSTIMINDDKNKNRPGCSCWVLGTLYAHGIHGNNYTQKKSVNQYIPYFYMMRKALSFGHSILLQSLPNPIRRIVAEARHTEVATLSRMGTDVDTCMYMRCWTWAPVPVVMPTDHHACAR